MVKELGRHLKPTMYTNNVTRIYSNVPWLFRIFYFFMKCTLPRIRLNKSVLGNLQDEDRGRVSKA